MRQYGIDDGEPPLAREPPGMAAAVAVAIAGVGAYFVEHWDRIAGSIVKGLQDGSITLVPLMTSLYTFYLRLVMVGEALMGGSSAVGTASHGRLPNMPSSFAASGGRPNTTSMLPSGA